MTEAPDVAGSQSLSVPRSRRSAWLMWATVVLVVVGVAAWFVFHPPALPTSQRPVTVSTPAGVAVYVAIYAPQGDSERSITISSIHASTGSAEADVTGLVCRGGSLGVTSDPTSFCTEVLPAQGSEVGPGDVLMLRLESETPGTVDVERTEVSYRDGLQRDTQPVGPAIRVTFLTR